MNHLISLPVRLKSSLMCAGLVAALGCAFLVGGVGRAQPASAAPAAVPVASESKAPASPQALKFYTCTVNEVFTWTNRLHIRCTQPAEGGITFFAVPASNASLSMRVQALATAAYLTSGSRLVIAYDDADLSGEGFNCTKDNCRSIIGVGF